MKNALTAIVFGAACIAGSSGAMADNERQWEGRISVTAPACENNPWVRFRENGYRVVCCGYDFSHGDINGNEMIRFIEEGIWPVGMEKWFDKDKDNIADVWEMWKVDISLPSYASLTASRIPPSAEDQQNYNNALGSIGQDEIQSKWEEWKQGGN